MSNSAFSPSVLTVPSGTSGSGELNLITNPVAVTNTTGWVGAGRGTSGGPLNPTIETYFTVLNTAGSESSTSGAYDVLSLPSGLQNKKLKVEFYYTSPAADTFKVSVYKGTTRVPLTTDVSGSTALPQSTTGKFVAYFDTDSSGTWTVSITRTAGTGSTALQFTNVVVGPGIQPQGAVVGEWQSYTPTITGYGTVTTLVGKYRRIGDSLQGSVTFTAGTTTATLAAVTLPTGLTIDATKLSYTSGSNNCVVGVLAASATPFDGSVVAGGFTLTTVYLVGNGSSSITGSLGNIWASAASITATFMVPIAEWAGSGTVQLAQNDVEFVSNDGTNNVYGPSGTLVGSIVTQTNRTVTFQTPIQAGDTLTVEVQASPTSSWIPVATGYAGVNLNFQSQNGVSYGLGLFSVTGNQAIVRFGTYAFNTSTYGAVGSAWSVETTLRWRVRKSSAGAAVGFGIVVPGVSSGLVSASGLPGNTTGNVVAAGYVGEYKTLTLASPLSITANTLQNVISTFTLDKGTWLIWGKVTFSFSAISFSGTFNVLNISVSTTSATVGVDSQIQPYLGGNMTSGTGYSVQTNPTVLNITSDSTPVYLVAQTIVASITGSYSNQCNIKAVRIA